MHNNDNDNDNDNTSHTDDNDNVDSDANDNDNYDTSDTIHNYDAGTTTTMPRRGGSVRKSRSKGRDSLGTT